MCRARAHSRPASTDGVNSIGITDDDRDRMGDFLRKSYLDRTAEDLLPDDEDADEE